jgi:hypothetical protein
MSAQNSVKVGPEKLADAAKAATKGRGLPPVHLWNPPYSGDLDMRIARDGTWFYQGSPITRPALVRLFSTILRRDSSGFVLVTPVERWGITVEDAPFVAVDFDIQGSGVSQVLRFTTNVGDEVDAGPDHPIRVEVNAETGEPAPYVMVRNGLEALIDRKSFYRLIDLAEHGEHDGAQWFGLWSGGAFFGIQKSDELT